MATFPETAVMNMKDPDFSYIDHLIFGAPDLQAGVAWVEERLGVKLSAGGQHPDFGTHNALFRLSEHTYFEVIASDPGLAPLNRPLWMGLDQIQSPRLIWWAAKKSDLAENGAKAGAAGWELGEVMNGSRALQDGRLLTWQLTDPYRVREGGVLPFLIDWGDGPHPTDRLPAVACRLTNFQLLHPQPETMLRYMGAINLEVEVIHHAEARIRAGFETGKGQVYF